jgi:hypothetical protein
VILLGMGLGGRVEAQQQHRAEVRIFIGRVLLTSAEIVRGVVIRA